MRMYSFDYIRKMEPLLRHYSLTIEELYGKLDILSSRISKTNPDKFKGKKKMKADKINISLIYRFDLIEERLMDVIIELNELGIMICTPIFGAIDIPVRTDAGRLVYVCYDHTVEEAEEFLAHKTHGKIKKPKLSRFLDC